MAFIPEDLSIDQFSSYTPEQKLSSMDVVMGYVLIEGISEITSFYQSDAGTIMVCTQTNTHKIASAIKLFKEKLMEVNPNTRFVE